MTLERVSASFTLFFGDLVLLCSPGCLGTAGALIYGLRAFHQGKTRNSQLLMRGRIFAQGFTVVAIIFGVFATAVKSKQWRRTNPTAMPVGHSTRSQTRSSLEVDWCYCVNELNKVLCSQHSSDTYGQHYLLCKNCELFMVIKHFATTV